ARGDPERGVRAVGDLRPDPVPAELRGAAAARRAGLDAVVQRRVLRQLAAHRWHHPRHHDRPLRRRGVPRGAPGCPRQPARGRSRDGGDTVGGGVDRGRAPRPCRTHRREDPGAGPGARRDDGGHDGHRQSPRHQRLGVAARLHYGRRDRQRVHRSGHRSAPGRYVRGRPRALHHHGDRERLRAPPHLAGGARHGGGEPRAVSARSLRRHVTSGLMTGLVAALSFVIGIFAWTWLVRPMGRFSALAGAVALAALMVPMIARTTEEMVRLVPHSLREAALALGYPRWRTSLRIVARTALAGIVTGCLVGIARIAGETAPLLFTALGNLNFSTSVLLPMQTLSLQIFTYATGPFEEWHRLAWGSPAACCWTAPRCTTTPSTRCSCAVGSAWCFSAPRRSPRCRSTTTSRQACV